jgi:hypothetical protein
LLHTPREYIQLHRDTTVTLVALCIFCTQVYFFCL